MTKTWTFPSPEIPKFLFKQILKDSIHIPIFQRFFLWMNSKITENIHKIMNTNLMEGGFSSTISYQDQAQQTAPFSFVGYVKLFLDFFFCWKFKRCKYTVLFI